MNKYFIVGNRIFTDKPEAIEDHIYTVQCKTMNNAEEFLRMLQRARQENPNLK